MPPGSDPTHFADYIFEEDLPQVKAVWASALDGRPTPLYFRWRKQPGEKYERWVFAMQAAEARSLLFCFCPNLRSGPQFDEAGNVVRIIGSLADTTEAKRAQLLERQRAEEAEASRRRTRGTKLTAGQAHKSAQERFVDTISHELRNPLSAICMVCCHKSP
jgi:signal transduction histidine kinase